MERNGLDGIAVFFGSAITPPAPTWSPATGSRPTATTCTPTARGDGIRVFGPRATNNAVGNNISNTVCGNAASGIRVDGGRKWNVDTLTWLGTKNNVKSNTVGKTSATPACANNRTNPAASPASNFDLYDTNVATNSSLGFPPCDSNIWASDSTTGTFNDPCVM